MTLPALFPKTTGNRGPLTLGGWDRVVIGGEVLPGKAKVVGAGTKLKKDTKDAAGKDGGNVTYHGLESQEFTVEVMVWTDEQLEELVRICRKLLPRRGDSKKPVSFDAASVRNVEITTVKVLGGTQFEESSEHRGARKMSFRLLHWLSGSGSKNVTKTPTRSVRNVRREDAEKKNPSNPLPTAQGSTVAPR